MKTKTRVLLLILLPIVLSLVTVAGLVWTHREVNRAAQIEKDTDDLVRIVFALNQVISQDLLYQKERTKIQFRTLYASFQKSLTRLKAEDVGESFLIRKMLGNQEEIGYLFPLVLGLGGPPSSGSEGRLDPEFREQVIGQLLILLEKIVSDSVDLMETSRNRMRVAVGWFNRVMMVVIPIGGMVTALLAFFIGQGILKNTRALQREIDERQAAEEALGRSELRYRIVADNTYDWEFWRSPEGRYLYVSPSCRKVTGHEPEEFIRDADLLSRIVFPEDLPIYNRHRQQMEEAEGTGSEIQYRIIRPDGSLAWIGHVCKRVFDAEGRYLGIRGSDRDITNRKRMEEEIRRSHDELEIRVRDRTSELTVEIEERKRIEEALRESQEELRRLSSRILTAQESERRKIARDLHDQSWQTLNRVILEANHLLSQSPAGDWTAVRQTAESILADTREAIGRIRSMQGELWPPVLDDLGILPTLSWYLREFEKNHAGFSTERQVEAAEEEIPQDIKIVIYRVMQEALKNAAQHSGAGRVRLSLKKEKERIVFAVNDDGKGFNLEQILLGTHPWVGFGLVSMKEKVEQSGGTFEVWSREEAGTNIRASWPLAGPREEALEKRPIRLRSPKSEDQFRVVTLAISDWVYALRMEPDDRLVLEWITPGFKMVTGYDLDEIYERPDMSGLLYPDDRPVAEERSRYIRARQAYTGEYRVVTKSGAICWIREAFNPIADPLHPESIRVVGAAQDITERKRIETALQEKEAILGGILDSVTESIVALNPEGYFLLANATALSRLERLPGEIIGLHASAVLPTDLVPSRLARLEEVVASARPAEFEDQRAGILFQHNLYPVLDEQGQVKAVVSFSRDITEGRRAERQAQFLDRLHPLFIQERSAEELIRRVLQVLSGHLDTDLAAFGELKPDGAIVVRQEYRENRASVLGAFQVGDFLTDEAVKAVLAGSRFVVTDVAADPRTTARRESFRRLELAAIMVEPLVTAEGPKIFIGVASSRPRAWRPDEAQLLRAVGARLFPAVERARAEKALRTSEEQLRRVVRAGRIGFYEWNTNQDNAYWSPEAYELFGRELNSPANFEAWRECVHPDDRERATGHVTALLEQARLGQRGGNHRNEYRVLHGDGTVLWLEAVTAFDLEDGTLVMRGVVRDITERQDQEETIRRAKEEWERTFDTVPDLIAILDNQHRVVRANRAMAERLGVTPKQCVGLFCYQVVHGTGAPPVFCPHAQTLGDGREHTEEVHEDRLGGDFLVSTTPIFGPEGQMTGSVHIARDITLRKRAENDIQRHLEKLQVKNEELLRFNRVAVGRELRMIELKKEINELYVRTGQPAKYQLEFDSIGH
jgi:PAS domain S-box-containing protein